MTDNNTRLIGAKPCPFCGGDWILIGMKYSAICVDCGATGPDRDKAAKAAKGWNDRAKTVTTQIDEKAMRDASPAGASQPEPQ